MVSAGDEWLSENPNEGHWTPRRSDDSRRRNRGAVCASREALVNAILAIRSGFYYPRCSRQILEVKVLAGRFLPRRGAPAL